MTQEEFPRFELHALGHVKDEPAAAMNPEDDRMTFALGRGEQVEGLPLVLRFDVDTITLTLGFAGRGHGGDEQEGNSGSDGRSTQ